MVSHLAALAGEATLIARLKPGDTVLDIGCSDGTLLANFPKQIRIGFDPVAAYCLDFLQGDSTIHTGFFDPRVYHNARYLRAKLVTCIAMFYDLDDPVAFLRAVGIVIADDGVLCIEIQFMPLCMRNRAIDVVCHEHAVYYDGRRLAMVLEQAGFAVEHVSFDDEINGGSVRVYARKRATADMAVLDRLCSFDPPDAAAAVENMNDVRRDIMLVGHKIRQFCTAPGQVVVGLGASTKGNVLLQYWGISTEHVSMIGEVNPSKFGHETPGTRIPIVDETELPANATLFVLPWWLKTSMIERYADRKLLFPLPRPHVWQAGQETYL